MRKTALLFLLLLPASVFADQAIDDLAVLLPGTFTSSPPDDAFIDRRIRIDAPAIGQYVFYLQINQNESLALYRQRILVLERDVDDRIAMRAYALVEPQRFVDAEAADIGGLDQQDLHPFLGDGCEQIWTRTDEGFRGYVDPAQCVIISSRTGKPRGIESETRLTDTEMFLVERGYDPEGNQLFGTPQGEFLPLKRIAAD